ncbi:MAG TPA: hypothetical protein VL863_13045 [bacterium]|nr:hypothetical protein [bacterium]
MKKKFKKSKSLRAAVRFGQRQPALGRYLLGASLLALGAQAPAADALIKPEQAYEGGTNTYNNWVTLSAGGLMTSGNKNAAEQGQRMSSGAFGGIEDLHFQTEVAKKTTFTLDGHSIFDQHNYSVGLGLQKEDLGYLRLLFDNYRTWDSGIGGYIPADRKTYALPGDALSLDRGQISFEAGLIKPNVPQVIFKYRHAYRDGEKSSTLWGPVHDGNGDVRRTYPGINDLDEKIDTFQLDLTHHATVAKKTVNYGVGVGYEHGDLNDSEKLTFWQSEPTQQKATDKQGTTYDLLSTHAFAESWLKDNLFFSTGFLYANLDDSFSGSRVYGDDFDVAYNPSYPGLGYGYTSLDGNAHKNEYIWNLNLMSQPTKNFSIIPSLRVQEEDWNADSSGTGTLGTDTQDFNSHSGRNSLDVAERLDFRYTGVTNWVFNLGGQWTEGQGNYFENGGLTQVNGIGPAPVKYATDDTRFFQKYFASTRWYPVRQASLDVGGYYKINTYNYNNNSDNTPDDLSGGSAYPGFIDYQSFETWDGNVRLTLRPISRVTLVSRYEYQYSTINMRPAGSSGLSEQETSTMNTHIIGQNASWTPLNWLGFQAGLNYVLSKTKTPASDYTQAILNAQNNYWTANFNANLTLDDKTDLDLGYYYYYANDFQVPAAGLGLGAGARQNSVTATLTRRITKNLRLNLKFAYTHFDDTSNGGYGDYDSSLVSSSLQYRF